MWPHCSSPTPGCCPQCEQPRLCWALMATSRAHTKQLDATAHLEHLFPPLAQAHGGWSPASGAAALMMQPPCGEPRGSAQRSGGGGCRVETDVPWPHCLFTELKRRMEMKPWKRAANLISGLGLVGLGESNSLRIFL